MTEKAQYGFYSATADAKFGHVLYEAPDGTIVKCTAVYPDSEAATYNWEDKEFVGPVVKFIDRVDGSGPDATVEVYTQDGMGITLFKTVATALGYRRGKTLTESEAWEALGANARHGIRTCQREIRKIEGGGE